MRQMTLRDIPEEIEMVVRNEASKKGVSLNKAFLTLLRKGTQQAVVQSPAVNRQRKSRFLRFCGIWSEEDTVEFDTVLLEQRKIDNEAWQ
ncbi:MAG: hypothetical protein J0665_03565 [Deltaproteobacteria bacterium]|jgi:hypothetical protein|nr:hypothetical protein [Deltaproteobacteria bacterium]